MEHCRSGTLCNVMGTVIKTLNFLCVLALNHCQFVGVEKVEAQDGGLISSGIDKVARP